MTHGKDTTGQGEEQESDDVPESTRRVLDALVALEGLSADELADVLTAELGGRLARHTAAKKELGEADQDNERADKVLGRGLLPRDPEAGALRAVYAAIKGVLGVEASSDGQARMIERVAAVGRYVEKPQTRDYDIAPQLRELSDYVQRVTELRQSKPRRRARLLAEALEARFDHGVDREQLEMALGYPSHNGRVGAVALVAGVVKGDPTSEIDRRDAANRVRKALEPR